MQYKEYPNREEWLQARKNSLGASEVASAMGMGFETQLDLWKEKTGKQPHKSLDDNERVNYGTQAEEHIRALFELKNKGKYKVEYFPFRIYQSKENPFMTCTLDGLLTRIADGKKGSWEGKSRWIMSKNDLAEWEDNRIPMKYYIQCISQIYVAELDFAILNAELIFQDGHSEIRNYEIERAEVENDIKYVVEESRKFWKYVAENKEPPLKISL